ncbi:MAG: aldo/keto reductase [Alphaproteobacteria bacterium]|nr:MAG: aldo/keto reductase [Alphaproteobacteria bacterium]
MKRRPFGRTGVRVTPICLGTMTFGQQCDQDVSFAIMDKAYDMGVDFFDTADVYPLGGGADKAGQTETIIGNWLADRGVRDNIFLATKCRGHMGPTVNDQGLTRYNIQRAVENSLKRLQTDVIDLYQTHFFDPHTPIDETLRALDDLVKSGKVRYIGCSNYPAWQLAEANGVAAKLNLARYESVQPRYNMLYREIETELLPLCRASDIGVIVYNPIAGGMLSGRYKAGQNVEENSRFGLPGAGAVYQARYWEDRKIEIASNLAAESEKRGLSLASVAVAWTLQQPGVTSAIVGASRPDQLDASIAGATLELDDEMTALCDAVWWDLPRTPVTEGYR